MPLEASPALEPLVKAGAFLRDLAQGTLTYALPG